MQRTPTCQRRNSTWQVSTRWRYAAAAVAAMCFSSTDRRAQARHADSALYGDSPVSENMGDWSQFQSAVFITMRLAERAWPNSLRHTLWDRSQGSSHRKDVGAGSLLG